MATGGTAIMVSVRYASGTTPDAERYYDRLRSLRRGLREIVVYERDGRYYRDDGRNDDTCAGTIATGGLRPWNDRDRGYDDRD